MCRRICEYIRHLFYFRHRKGFGIHSPYIFEFVNKLVFNGAKIHVPKELTDSHRKLKKDPRKIPVIELGAPSNVNSSGERSVASFVRGSSVTIKYGKLLYRICRWFEPDQIIELGTGLGISTLYLASACPGAQTLTIEGNKHRAAFAEDLLESLGLEAVSIYQGDIGEVLESLVPNIQGNFVAYVDGNHRYEPTMAYLRALVGACEKEAVIIMDDIYWSKEMSLAWRELLRWPEVRVSIDLYQMGILMLRKDLHKADYKIRF